MTTVPRTAVPSSGFGRVAGLLAEQQCVVLDGGIATELPAGVVRAEQDERLWGTSGLIDAPDAVRDIHRRYVAAGCDVITTNTWGLPTALAQGGPRLRQSPEPVHWMDVARRGVAMAREAIDSEGRASDVAVALSLNGDLDTPDSHETVALLARALAGDPPDLILLETLSLVRDSLFATVDALLATGLPLWLSFRRCRNGLCGVFGQHWGGPEGDRFGRAARRLEDHGIAALLINCIPPDHVAGMLPFLRDFTDLPLGVYPNLGYYTDQGWHFDPGVDGNRYADMTLTWRADGAQIIGGCCGVTPDHIHTTRTHLDTHPLPPPTPPAPPHPTPPRPAPTPTTTWTDPRGRTLYPLGFPELRTSSGVFAPTEGSYLVWRHLADHGIGEGKRCLDVGCGAGLQTIQLALNGAAHVHGIDVDARAVEDTMTNAFRNGVADRVSAATVDLYPWVPDERYDVITASLYQTPVDPAQQTTSHRPFDFWGRNAVDHLIRRLPDALAGDGAAYMLHLSILSGDQTDQMLAAHGLSGRVVDFAFFPMSDHFQSAIPQIAKVERRSDAHHLQIGGVDTIVAYLLEIRLAGRSATF
jgi:S-methylmethionine-dependent homocysteine/selenocysteine methylase/SAM-dependent methyltransferase